MAAKSFKSKIVEAAYNDFNSQGILAVIEHCVVSGLPHASYADDNGNSTQMRKPIFRSMGYLPKLWFLTVGIMMVCQSIGHTCKSSKGRCTSRLTLAVLGGCSIEA